MSLNDIDQVVILECDMAAKFVLSWFCDLPIDKFAFHGQLLMPLEAAGQGDWK